MAPVKKSDIKGKKGKKPPKNFNKRVSVAMGKKKAPRAKGEVSARGAWPAWYYCWNCGAANFVPGGVYSFICWRDGCYNLAP